MNTLGMLMRPVINPSAAAYPPPPGVVFQLTTVNGTPSFRSADWAAAENGQYVAENTAT
jgi:hypothetical protein